MIVRKSLTLSTLEYYVVHFTIINMIIPPLLRITPREIDVLAVFLTLSPEIRFTTLGKKKVKEILGLSPSSLSTHMKALITKRFILTESGEPIAVANNIIPSPTQEYQIKITHDPSLEDSIPQHEENNLDHVNNTYQDQGEEEAYEADYQH